MFFRLSTKVEFQTILLSIIWLSLLSSSLSLNNSTRQPKEAETFDRRRWRRDESEGELCNPEKMRSIVTYPGESVVLKCSTCGRTDFRFSVWMVQLTGSDEPVKLSALQREELIREGPIDLAVTSVVPDIGGIYMCLVSETQGVYEIIVKTLPKFEVVFSGEGSSEDTSRDVFTNWGAWTKCSAAKCGTPGERSRIGLCNYRVRQQMYADGVPCRSSIVTGWKREKLKDIPDKKMIQACQQGCSGGGKSTSLSKKMPKLPPMVTQKALYAKAGENVALSCSGVSVVAYVRWEVDDTMIRQIDLQREGDEHLSIDEFHTLHIRSLRDTDQGTYGCWHNDVLHQSYKVKIVKPPPDTKEAEGGALWVGIVLTFIVLAVIAIGVFKAWRMKRRVV